LNRFIFESVIIKEGKVEQWQETTNRARHDGGGERNPKPKVAKTAVQGSGSNQPRQQHRKEKVEP